MSVPNWSRPAAAAGVVVAAALGMSAGATPAPPDRLTPVHVLYVDGLPRWEYRQHRQLLVDPARRAVGFQARVALLSADDGPAAAPARPPVFPARGELDHFDVVVLGDVDPADPRLGPENLKNLARFVRDGGGLVVIAGPHHAPHDLKGTPLEAVLPIDLGVRPEKDGAAAERKDGYRPVPTAAGCRHPAFRLGAAPAADAVVRAAWQSLPEMYWWADGYAARAGAEVLATHPTAGGKHPHPLVVRQTVGRGKCLFVGFDETWRWRREESDRHHRAFWLAAWQSVAAD